MGKKNNHKGFSADEAPGGFSPPADRPAHLRPPPRGQLAPTPVALTFEADDDADSDSHSFSSVRSTEQQLRKRPAPVAMPAGGSASGGGPDGRPLAGYRQGSASFGGAVSAGLPASADGRRRSTATSPLNKGSGGTPSKGSAPSSSPRDSPKNGGESSPRANANAFRRDGIQPLDSLTARKIDSLQSEKSTPLEKRPGGMLLESGHSGRSPSLQASRWPLFSFMSSEVRGDAPVLTRQHRREKQRIAQRMRVYNTLSVPVSLERLVMFGTALCMDAFLFLFTLLPLRVASASPRALLRLVPLVRSRVRPLFGSESVDLIRALILWIVCWSLFAYIDISKTYHLIRAQATIKLYVIYNLLEISDKMCCYVGPDVLDALYWTASGDAAGFSGAAGGTSSGEGVLHGSGAACRGSRARRNTASGAGGWSDLAWDFSLAIFYVFIHAVVMIYQVVTLQVAMHSSNNALLTLLVSNNFVELKGSIFKKFASDNLFQITSADMSERFQLVLVLFIMFCQQLDRTTTQTLSTDNAHGVWASLSEVSRSATDVVFGSGGSGEAGVSSGAAESIPVVMIVLWVCEIIVDWIVSAATSTIPVSESLL